MLRIELLGEGNAAEVHKYQLSEPQRGTPPFLVAAKTAKAADDGGATRTELLEEAAILALLNHRNMLPLVGVVTVPTNLPLLVLLMYCERGTLKDHVANAGVGGISTATLLTFCAEVLQGLYDISSRRIVHRDIAARNVLLDANEVCKLADFGRAVALADVGVGLRQDDRGAADPARRGRGAGVGAVLDGIGHLVLRLHGVGGALGRRGPLPRHRELHRSLELCAGGKADVGASGAAGRHPPAADAAVLGSPSGRPTEHSRAIHHSGQPRGNPGRPGPGRDAAHGRRREASARVSRYSSAACRHTS